jgi:maltodextrin utilization protein YvdJ
MVKSWLKVLVVIGSLLILSMASGCALQMVSNFDMQTEQQIMDVAKKVDRFYVQLSELPKEKRTFHFSLSTYLNIEVELSALLMRQKVRELNELTTKQVEITQNLWLQDKKQHQQANSISDFLIKTRKQQYQRLFLAMIRGEQAKQ